MVFTSSARRDPSPSTIEIEAPPDLLPSVTGIAWCHLGADVTTFPFRSDLLPLLSTGTCWGRVCTAPSQRMQRWDPLALLPLLTDLKQRQEGRGRETLRQESSLNHGDQQDQDTALRHSSLWRRSEPARREIERLSICTPQPASHLSPQFPHRAPPGTHRCRPTPGPSGPCHFSQHDEAGCRYAANSVDGFLCYFLTVQVEFDLEAAHCHVHLGGKSQAGLQQRNTETFQHTNAFCPIARVGNLSKSPGKNKGPATNPRGMSQPLQQAALVDGH